MAIDFAKEMDDFFRENVHKMDVGDLLIALIGHGEELMKKYEREETEMKKPLRQTSANPENCGGSSKKDAGDDKATTVAGDNIRGKRSKNVIVEQEDDFDCLLNGLDESISAIEFFAKDAKELLEMVGDDKKRLGAISTWYTINGRVTCARCGLTQMHPATYYNYCPKCGARMLNGDMGCED